MPQKKRDLTLSGVPEPRKITLDVSQIKPSALTLMDALDIAEASGISHNKFAYILQQGSEREKALIMYAMAWVFARRVEPDLTWEEVRGCDLVVVGEAIPAAVIEREQRKTNALVNVAKITGTTPEVAGQMSISEVAAFMPSQRRRKRA